MRPRHLAAARILSATLALSPVLGCMRFAPKMPKNLSSPAPILYTPGEFDRDVQTYRTAVKSRDAETARTERNQIVFRIMAQIEAAYGHFEASLTTSRAAALTSADAAQLGLTAAATVVGAAGVKNILTATATALGGTRLSFDKNFFEQKTTESLIAQMRASRKTQQAQMLRGLATRDVQSYPLENAWTDLVRFYYAGTIPSALVEISSKAGADAVKADGDLKDTIRELTPVTPRQARQALDTRSAFERLSRDLTGADPAVRQRAAADLRSVLDRIGLPAKPGETSPDDLLASLRGAMLLADHDPAFAGRLADAIRDVLAP